MVFHGDKLRELRTKRHLSQEALATQIGVAKSAISQYECGKRTPEFAIAQKICMFFDCKLSDIADVPELIPFLGHDPFGMEKNRSQSNINIGTNNGAVSGNGNATVIEYPLTDDKLEVSLRAMLGDSVETDDIVQALTDGVTVLKDLDDFDRQNLRLYLQGIVNVIKKAKANGDKRITISAAQ